MDMSFFHQDDHAQHILDRDSAHLLPVYARFPVVMDHGKGVYLYDTSGNRYLDLMAGLGVNALGHAHPRMVAAMAGQAGQMVHLSPQYASRYPAGLPNPGVTLRLMMDGETVLREYIGASGPQVHPKAYVPY